MSPQVEEAAYQLQLAAEQLHSATVSGPLSTRWKGGGMDLGDVDDARKVVVRDGGPLQTDFYSHLPQALLKAADLVAGRDPGAGDYLKKLLAQLEAVTGVRLSDATSTSPRRKES